jgi:branched-chain amino acid transport system ATP-binding protein
MGLVPPQGSVRFRGRELAGLRSDLVARAGIGYVPEDRQVFPTLSVRQNLELGLKKARRFGRWTFDDVFGLLLPDRIIRPVCFPGASSRC